jgi:hypothetical protein
VVSEHWVDHGEIDLLIVHHTNSCQIGEIGADRLLKFSDWIVHPLQIRSKGLEKRKKKSVIA